MSNCLIKLSLYLWLLLGTQAVPLAFAASEEEEDNKNKTVLDTTPVASARAKGMGGAISTLADGSDAPFYNPAGIGGIHNSHNKRSFIRQFYFMYGAASFNENSQNLNEEFRNKGGLSDAGVGQAIVDAHGGDRQYGGISIFPNSNPGRLILGPIYGSELAAVPVGEDSGLVDLHYQTRSGAGLGASVTDPKGRLYLGVFSYYLGISDVAGRFEYTSMLDKTSRKDAFDDYTSKYSGVATNLGMLWCFSEKGRPSLGVVVRDLGKTKYKKSKGDGPDTLVADDDLTVGFSVSPSLGKIGFFNFILEGGNLNDENMATAKKWKTGMELTFGGQGIHSVLGLRAGANAAGASFGSHLNLGLIGVQYANYAEDIGIDNNRIIERRQNVTLSIDLAE